MPQRPETKSFMSKLVEWGIAKDEAQSINILSGVAIVCICITFYLLATHHEPNKIPAGVDWKVGESVLESN